MHAYIPVIAVHTSCVKNMVSLGLAMPGEIGCTQTNMPERTGAPHLGNEVCEVEQCHQQNRCPVAKTTVLHLGEQAREQQQSEDVSDEDGHYQTPDLASNNRTHLDPRCSERKIL